MREVYDIYNPSGEFEVVFVALGNNENVFLASFSHMPWLAIPHENHQARDFFKNEFVIPNLKVEKAVLFAPDGTLLLDDAARTFSFYGSHFFPFTRQRIRDISDECDAIREQLFSEKQVPPLTSLLGSHVLTCNGKKASISLSIY